MSELQGQTGSLEVDVSEDRYSRLRLIHWWDQERLRAAKVMVVGAGALGNEILKNLALLGIGGVYLVDFDVIEDSNLTRSILFTASDVGRLKAVAAADRAQQANPDVVVHPVAADVIYDVGMGVFAEMDIIFGALDNREARVAINQAAWRVGKPWIDGAIEVVMGVARMFVPPDGPCYECTLSELDYKLLGVRKSCALLTREEIELGKVPTTPTTASVIAGIQVQEAIKWLHRDRNLPVLAGKGFFFNGLTHDSYVIEYQVRKDCPAHYTYPEVRPLNRCSYELRAGELLQMARREMGEDAVVEFEREIVTGLRCTQCGTYERVFGSLSKIRETQAKCPRCGLVRDPDLAHAIYGDEDWLDLTLRELGLPLYDIVTFRSGMQMRHYLIAGDRDLALGRLARIGPPRRAGR